MKQIKNTKALNFTNPTDVSDFLRESIKSKPDDLVISDTKWKYLVRSVIRGKNVLMVGPTGCGKTIAAKFAAESLFNEFTDECDEKQLEILKNDKNIKIIKKEKI